MSWQERSVMSLKEEFVNLCGSGLYSMSYLCELYGISRKTGYKWLGRYEKLGLMGLLDKRSLRSERKHIYAQDIWGSVFALREENPTWGAKKLLKVLERLSPQMHWPSASRVKQELSKNGFITQKKPRLTIVSERLPLRESTQPNDIWCIDFKGWFMTKDKKRCEPLTLIDNHSRYLLSCSLLSGKDFLTVKKHLEKMFIKYGKPLAIRSDNGTPFGSGGCRGLSPLSVWLLKNGIWPEKITPGKPNQNGRLERLHRTLKADVLKDCTKANYDEVPTKLHTFAYKYNYWRPHEALNDNVPANLYQKSTLTYTASQSCGYMYPQDCRVLQVTSSGYLTFKNEKIYLTESLAGECVGVEQADEHGHRIVFLGYPLGYFEQHKIRTKK